MYSQVVDARVGYRSGNANHEAGPFNGRYLHLGVAVSAVASTNGATKISFQPRVPPLVLLVTLVPAGSHPARAVLQQVLSLHDENLTSDVVADRGYTQLDPRTLHLPLQRAGSDLYMDLKENQWG
ncbi:MAG: hypothetical protein ACYDEH_03560 [Acidimicrobiales bacterium]